MTEDEIQIIVVALLVTVYWSFRGLIGMFQRYNAILVIVYLIFLFPIAYIHMLLLGIFGDSKKKRLENEAKEEAKKQAIIEEEKQRIQSKN
jgi:hypothetical protein